MAFAISKYARGLPSLLDLKERGMGPREFSEQVVGTIDLTPLYLLQGRETLSLSPQAAPAVGQNSWGVAVIVPANEIWYVWQYSAAASPGAGAAIELTSSANFDGTAGFALGPIDGASATQHVRTRIQAPIIATPGTEFTFLVRSVTLAPLVSGAIQVTKLRV
jgi:hypothetical protein